MSARRVDQEMAAAAADMLVSATELTSAEQKALRTRYRQLRIMLHGAGLAATYAFVAAKAGSGSALDRAYAEAASGIRVRLRHLRLLAGDEARLDPKEILRQLGKMDGIQYARASAEVTALVGWLSRLADACYEGGSDDGDGASQQAAS
jgi:CRISPR/Cas system CMR-associated protein Cmr5 small subunit